MTRRLIAVASFLPLASPGGLSAQTIRHERGIALPSGVSVSIASVARAGTFVAGICSDNVVRLWALPSGKLAQSLDSKSDRATGLQLSDDGRLLAIATQTGSVKVWDVVSWKVQQEFSAPSTVYLLAISPDNRLLAGATDSDSHLWNLAEGKYLSTLRVPFGFPFWLAFSPDSALLASADGDTSIRVYDAHTGALRSTVTDLLLESFALEFSPDGRSLYAGGADRAISVIDPTNGKILRTLPRQPGVPKALVVSPDGKQIAAMYPLPNYFIHISVVLVWDLSAQTVRARFEKPGVFVLGGTFATGRLLLIGSSANELSVWSVQ